MMTPVFRTFLVTMFFAASLVMLGRVWREK
jgi:hypothetical protein